jgi:hypothetical protein
VANSPILAADRTKADHPNHGIQPRRAWIRPISVIAMISVIDQMISVIDQMISVIK